jgi:hypothetical protein
MAPIHIFDATSGENSQAAAASPCPVPPPAPKDYGNGNPNARYKPPGARNTDSCLLLKPAGEVVHDYSTKGPAPGDIVFRWIHGSVCAAKNTDPRIQVVAYNEDTYILRENPCVNWEAPFTYLLFGNHGALLIDTGATPEASYYPLRVTVDEIVSRWCGIRRKKSVPLTVVLTSGEDVAQNQGIGQFADRAQTGLTPLELGAHGVSRTKQFMEAGIGANRPRGSRRRGDSYAGNAQGRNEFLRRVYLSSFLGRLALCGSGADCQRPGLRCLARTPAAMEAEPSREVDNGRAR